MGQLHRDAPDAIISDIRMPGTDGLTLLGNLHSTHPQIPIIIMTALQENEGAAKGGLYAIRSVVMDSSRHIISTTVTTFGGFLPLILEGSQFWPPFAMAIGGGVLLSTIISFFAVPPLFLLATRVGRKQLTPLQNNSSPGTLMPASAEGTQR